MLQLHMIPTSGDTTLLRFYEGENEVNILIDGGNRKNNCIDYLKKLRIPHIDLLIVSHLDEDHINGLRRIADEIAVKELWITDISPLIQHAVESLYMMKCFLMTSMIVDGRAVKKGNKLAVYDGYEKQIGPFYLQVLSPPKSLHDYLRNPDVVRDILKSKKGQTIKKYVRKLWEAQTEGEGQKGRDQYEGREKIVSDIVDRFNVDTPQAGKIRELIERDAVDPTYWQEVDKYYESARSLFNDISIVVSITYSYHGITKRFLFPGDLTNWSIVLAKYPQLITNRILKVPHHGSEIYCDPEDYSVALLENYFYQDFWRRLHHPRHHILDEFWEERHFIVREILRGRISPQNSHFLGFQQGIPSMWWNNKDIYEWLAPERALIYPFKSRKLPRLDIRNQIINASKATSCTFSQGRISEGMHGQSDSCIDCYNCTEGEIPMVFEWRETDRC